jgi:hypothetical protein
MEKEQSFFEDESRRAQDILLGALGFGGDARIIELQRDSPKKYSGKAVWEDGEEFNFESDEELQDLELWALTVLLGNKKKIFLTII